MTDHKRKDLQLFFPAFIIWIILVIVPSFSNIQDLSFSFSSPMMVAGTILFIAGLIITVNAQMTLKKNYSGRLRIREDHQLVTHGIYRYVRHPVYTGSLIRAVAIPLFTTSLLGFLFALTGIPLFIFRIGVEEKMLIAEFGDEYQEYTKTSWKLFPYIV